MTSRPDSATIEAVFRAEYGRAVAVLVRVFGDIDIAEEAVQDAFATAVRRWPETGPPPSPAGWIITVFIAVRACLLAWRLAAQPEPRLALHFAFGHLRRDRQNLPGRAPAAPSR